MTAQRMRKQIPQIRTDFVLLIHKKMSNKKVHVGKHDVKLHKRNVSAVFSCVLEYKGNVLSYGIYSPTLIFAPVTKKTG